MEEPIMRRGVSAIACTLLLWLICGTSTAATDEASRDDRREVGNLVIEGIPEIPESLRQRIQQYQNTRRASLLGWLPSDGGILVRTRFGETDQIHLVKKPGGTRQQITFFHEPIRSAAVNPDPKADGFLFGKDVGGSEFFQLFFFDLSTGRHTMLTDGQSRNGGALWSRKGDRFVYYTTKRNGRDWDLEVGTTASGEKTRTVLKEGGVWVAEDWSPDDTKLVVTRYVSINETYPHILDLATSELTPIGDADEKVSFQGTRFAGDGRGVYVTSDRDSEFQRLRYRDLESGETRVLTADIPWDIEEFTLSEDGRHLAFTANEDAISRLQVLDTKSLKSLPLPRMPVGQIYDLTFSPDGGALGMVISTSTSPADVYVLGLETREFVRWTHSEVGGLKSDAFVEPELVRYETFDRVDGRPRTIPAFYYKPRGKGPFPVLVRIHGGPEGQAYPSFSPLTQYYVNELGIAVIIPNVRGSSGYGKSYLLLDNGYKREDSVKDIGALLDWIDDRPELDSKRIALIGGSYGGYMVLSSMTHYNDRIRAAIDIVGISNFVTFLENTKDYRRDLRRAEYGDERDPDMRRFLNRISPATNARKITKPLFVAQGLNDPRVPASESEQMVEAIRKNGGAVWYLMANDEGHGFRKKVNRDYYSSAVVMFLEEHLLDRQ
jgi:dipeptidyl aminopeptidase/acylaminoacyl peptidase